MFNIFSQFFRNRRAKLRGDAPHIQAVAAHSSANLSPPIDAGSPRVYEQSPWVYIAINRIAEAGALVPLEVYRLQNEERIGIKDHPLERLLTNPNPLTSRFELFEQTLGSLELHGNAYWYLAGDERGMPREIWMLRPDRVAVVPHQTRVVGGYLYQIDGQFIPLDSIEVIHFRRWHPSDDFYGLSPIQAARAAVLSDRHMADWNRQTFWARTKACQPASSASRTTSAMAISSASNANGGRIMAGRSAKRLSCGAAPLNGSTSA